MLGWLTRRKAEPAPETRSTAGFTATVLALREAHIAGTSGLAELSATVQGCVSLWEAGFSTADVEGTDLLDRQTMALIGRALALRGEAVFLVDGDRLIPAVDWDLGTVASRPRAYRLSLPEIGGGRSVTALAQEVLHFRHGSDPAAPWAGTPPLRRASLSAGLLHQLEAALGEVWATAPIGSMVVPFPEAPGTDLNSIARDFRGRRGRVLLRESVNVAAAGGPAPNQDWRPQGTTPDLEQAQPVQTLEAARHAVAFAFGVVPALLNAHATGPVIREAQRQLCQWTLEPLAKLVAEEATAKLGSPVAIDVARPLVAYDAGGKARAFAGIIGALAQAKEAQLDPAQVEAALRLLDWGGKANDD